MPMTHRPRPYTPEARKNTFVRFDTVSIRASAIVAVVGSAPNRSQIYLAGSEHVITVPKSVASIIKAIEELS